MIRRMSLHRIWSVTFYVGLLLLLSVDSKNSTMAVFEMAELTPRVVCPYGAMPINIFSFDTLLDREYFVNVFSMPNVPLEIDLHNIPINNVPVPTIAFLFPFALLLLLAQSRRLIDKVYSYMAFPVF